MSPGDQLDLLLHFALLSAIAVGGAVSMVPDISQYLVDERAFLTAAQFSEAIAIAQAVPGPNVLFITLLGFQAAGVIGAVLATLGLLIPSSVITYYANLWRSGNLDTRLVRAIRLGLSPLAVGLTLAAGWVIAEGAVTHWLLALFCALAVVVPLGSRINPLWLIGLGALLGPLLLP
jgi:chromate transporter